ncbi:MULTISPECIES: iron-containing alcohol dehydrogenase family protein [unclassified Paenibacillus]|uniref:iron-containing alcohol dehydrogenase family protein n=1 Tax=unclassified Paenibacillus TaxID=185978 RepID=UPI00095639BD|nr:MULTISPECIES: iron-containing alcohol dehydrogenase family protein [unclassified Paenibacillus]ASS64928.1 iron-containing alcohol dehydrogenase family protein [Paenibacillus sp. RUD330]SIR01147.1 glycerol dehydrogenase [Paenibacillus sp. RU4X]SIR33839.1 glycerol dehydrogenase [Paenibacillus sp. RU4T]
MIAIKAPLLYRNESALLEQKGLLEDWEGRIAVIISGNTAWDLVSSQLASRLGEAHIPFSKLSFKGYCTQEKIGRYTLEAERLDPSFLIGIGGGSVLDLTKAVGDKLGLPVLAIPTVAATCAAWSALAVLYDDAGRSAGYLPLSRSPELVLADARVLAQAPRRYLASGIADTIVKWHEHGVNAPAGRQPGLDLQLSLHAARLALDLLTSHSARVYEAVDVLSPPVGEAFSQTIDAVIVLAGLAGSIHSGVRRAAFAHAIHDRLTWFPETQGTLHGEKVGFGLLSQLVLEGKADEAVPLAALFRRIGLPVTLEELGFKPSRLKAHQEIASGIQLPEEAEAALAFDASPVRIAQAIAGADAIGRTAAANLMTGS